MLSKADFTVIHIYSYKFVCTNIYYLPFLLQIKFFIEIIFLLILESINFHVHYQMCLYLNQIKFGGILKLIAIGIPQSQDNIIIMSHLSLYLVSMIIKK